MPELVVRIEKAGVTKDEILILVATGMHRPSTRAEYLQMFGAFIVENYHIIDHDCSNADDLVQLPERSWSGSLVRLNKHYVQAGFRIITGLVEPHFMAGFSGGRKAICPGLVDLETIQKFHGYPLDATFYQCVKGLVNCIPAVKAFCQSTFSFIKRNRELDTVPHKQSR